VYADLLLQLLVAIAKASSLYYNYTGSKSCLNTSQESVQSLGDVGWNFQVIWFVMIHHVGW